MNQSTVITGCLALAFLIFITIKGELPIYMGFLLGSGTGASATPSAPTIDTRSSPAGGPSQVSMADAAKLAMLVL